MAKKKQVEEIKLSSEELVPTTIGTITENNSAGKLLIVLFVFLIGFTFGVPFLSEYLEEYKKNNTPSTSNPGSNISKPGNEDKDPNDDKKDVVYHTLNDSLVITTDGYQLSNFKFDATNGTFSYGIKNVTGDISYFSNNLYYFEFYSENKTLLQRIKAYEGDFHETTSTYNDVKNVRSDIIVNVYYVVLIAKTVDDYPNVVLQKETDDKQFLTCQKNNHTIKYLFDKDFELYQMTDAFSYSNMNIDYDTVLADMSKLNATYNSQEGVASILTENNSNFNMNTVIDLSVADLTIPSVRRVLNNEAYYAKGTLAKKVYFELTNLMYECK